MANTWLWALFFFLVSGIGLLNQTDSIHASTPILPRRLCRYLVQVSCRLSSMPRRDFSAWIFVHSGERWVTEFLEELHQHGRLNRRVVTGTNTWFCQGSPKVVSWGWKMMRGVVSPVRWDGGELVFYSKNQMDRAADYIGSDEVYRRPLKLQWRCTT